MIDERSGWLLMLVVVLVVLGWSLWGLIRGDADPAQRRRRRRSRRTSRSRTRSGGRHRL